MILSGASGQVLKPYTLGAVSEKTLEETKTIVRNNLEENGFTVLGEYAPAGDWNRWLFAITTDEILEAAGAAGDLGGFAAVLRVGITQENERVLVTYTTPEYWWNACLRGDYQMYRSRLLPVNRRLSGAIRESGSPDGESFGSRKGIEADDLHTYRYMVSMPRFHNTVLLNTFSSHQLAIEQIEANLSKGVENIKKVYSVNVPGKKQVLYGLALHGDKGESKFLPIIDISNPMHTAFLPYEILVSGTDVHMLHGRFRIALSFPDLTMGTFTKIMSTPGDIEDQLKAVTE